MVKPSVHFIHKEREIVSGKSPIPYKNQSIHHVSVVVTNLGSFRFLVQFQSFLFKGFHTTKGRPDHDPDPLRVNDGIVRVPVLSILQCLSCRGHGKVGVPIVGFDIFGIDKKLGRIKEFLRYLRGNLTGIVLYIKALDFT